MLDFIIQVSNHALGQHMDEQGSLRRRWLGWFLFANGLLLCLIGLRYYGNASGPDGLQATAFLLSSYPSHFVSLAFIPFLLLWLISFTRNRALSLAAITWACLLVWLIVIDTKIFALFRYHINGMVWSLLINGGITEIIPFSLTTWLSALGLLLGAIGLQLLIARACWYWVRKKQRHGRKILASILLLSLSGHLLHAWADAHNNNAVTQFSRYLPAYPGLVMKRQLSQWGIIDRHNMQKVTLGSTSQLNYPRNDLQCQPQLSPPNVLMIVIDSWRFDMMSEKVTPHIWQFSRHASVFENHFSSGNATRFGIFGLFYGLYGSYWHSMLDENRGPLLIDELRRQHYDLSIHASARLTSPEFDRTVFATVKDDIALQTPGGDAIQRDQRITADFIAYLQQKPEKFFGFLFYDGTHSYAWPKEHTPPFSPIWESINHMELNNEFDPTPYRNRLLNASHYVDTLVADILDALKQQDLMDKTIIMITGDHGEEFNESGGNYWGHTGNFSRYQAQVPFILHWPGKQPQHYQHLSSHHDWPVSLMQDVLGCSNPADDYSHGRNLFTTDPRDFLLISDWSRVGVYSPGRIDVFYDSGLTEHYNRDYQPMSGNQPDPALISRLMLGLGAFRK